MTTATENAEKRAIWNVPNQLSLARLVLAVVVLVLIAWQAYVAAMCVFLIAAGTDWVDGWWARRFDQVTRLGRVLDPFVDKIIICGTFIYLASIPGSEIAAWMAVIVVGRELLVTALRSFIESGGGDFSAMWSGKVKMALQCAAVVGSLLLLALTPSPDGLIWTVRVLAWLAVLSTIQSGVGYVRTAAKSFRE